MTPAPPIMGTQRTFFEFTRFEDLVRNVENVQKIDSASCRGFHVLPREFFYPVHYTDVNELFIQRMANETDSTFNWLTEKVVGVHTWNKMSKNERIYKNSRQDYNRLVEDNCPAVFSIAPKVF